jgi:hypothetical protein
VAGDMQPQRAIPPLEKSSYDIRAAAFEELKAQYGTVLDEHKRLKADFDDTLYERDRLKFLYDRALDEQARLKAQLDNVVIENSRCKATVLHFEGNLDNIITYIEQNSDAFAALYETLPKDPALVVYKNRLEATAKRASALKKDKMAFF